MNIKLGFWNLLLAICFISCNNDNEIASSKNAELQGKDSSHDINETIATNSDSILNKLQGKWKEIEYPFRLIDFKNTTVKFTEEGVVEEPAFKEFKISNDCPFKVNNIKNATNNDIYLVMASGGICEILKVSNDTLTLSGFNTNTNSDYNIIYHKVE